MSNYQNRLERGRAEHGVRFDPVDLEAVDAAFRTYYGTGTRVRVETNYEDGEPYVRTGTVSTTTGWKPAFLLMHRSNAYGSSDLIGPRDRIIAVQSGRKYVPVR